MSPQSNLPSDHPDYFSSYDLTMESVQLQPQRYDPGPRYDLLSDNFDSEQYRVTPDPAVSINKSVQAVNVYYRNNPQALNADKDAQDLNMDRNVPALNMDSFASSTDQEPLRYFSYMPGQGNGFESSENMADKDNDITKRDRKKNEDSSVETQDSMTLKDNRVRRRASRRQSSCQAKPCASCMQQIKFSRSLICCHLLCQNCRHRCCVVESSRCQVGIDRDLKHDTW